MFVNKTIKGKNNFLKYSIGILLLIFSSFIGQLPFLGAIYYNFFVHKIDFPVGYQELMTFFDSNTNLILVLIPSVCCFISLHFVLKYLHGQKMINIATNRKFFDWNRLFFSFSIWGMFIFLSTIVSYVLKPTNFELNFNFFPFLILLIIATILIPIQTSTEELIFRGYLMQGFEQMFPYRWFSILITAIIFGLMHINNPEVSKIGTIALVYYIGTGLFLGIITVMDDGLELALGFHAANNLLSILLVTSNWTVFQTYSVLKDNSEPDIFFDIFCPILVVYPILLYIFSYKYRWTNWRNKILARNN